MNPLWWLVIYIGIPAIVIMGLITLIGFVARAPVGKHAVRFDEEGNGEKRHEGYVERAASAARALRVSRSWLYVILGLVAIVILFFVITSVPWNLSGFGDFFADFSIGSLSIPVLLAILGIALFMTLIVKKRVLTALLLALAVLLVFAFRTHIGDMLGTSTFVGDWDVNEGCTPESRQCIFHLTDPAQPVELLGRRAFNHETMCFHIMRSGGECGLEITPWDQESGLWVDPPIIFHCANPARRQKKSGFAIGEERVTEWPFSDATVKIRFFAPNATPELPAEVRVRYFTQELSASECEGKRWWTR